MLFCAAAFAERAAMAPGRRMAQCASFATLGEDGMVDVRPSASYQQSEGSQSEASTQLSTDSQGAPPHSLALHSADRIC